MFFDPFSAVVGVEDRSVVFRGDLLARRFGDLEAVARIGDLLGRNGDFERNGDLSLDESCDDAFKVRETFNGDLRPAAVADFVTLLSSGDLDLFKGDFVRIGDFEVSFLVSILLLVLLTVFLKAFPKLLRYCELVFELCNSCFFAEFPPRSGLFDTLTEAPTRATRYGDLLVRLSGDLLLSGLLSLEPKALRCFADSTDCIVFLRI